MLLPEGAVGYDCEGSDLDEACGVSLNSLMPIAGVSALTLLLDSGGVVCPPAVDAVTGGGVEVFTIGSPGEEGVLVSDG